MSAPSPYEAALLDADLGGSRRELRARARTLAWEVGQLREQLKKAEGNLTMARSSFWTRQKVIEYLQGRVEQEAVAAPIVPQSECLCGRSLCDQTAMVCSGCYARPVDCRCETKGEVIPARSIRVTT